MEVDSARSGPSIGEGSPAACEAFSNLPALLLARSQQTRHGESTPESGGRAGADAVSSKRRAHNCSRAVSRAQIAESVAMAS